MQLELSWKRNRSLRVTCCPPRLWGALHQESTVGEDEASSEEETLLIRLVEAVFTHNALRGSH